MSFPDQYQQLGDVPECRQRNIDFTGNGTGTPTKNYGPGATITRAGTGDYKITFSDNPGTFTCMGEISLRSATGTDIKNFSVIPLNYDATNKVQEVLVFNSSGTATDLTTVQSLTIAVVFRRTKVTG